MESDGARIALNQEREKLVRQLDELGATETGDLRPDLEFGDGFADAGAATAERTEVLGLVESLKGQLASVDQALIKIANGTYGSCDKCGRLIPPARLEARPASVLCIDCKNQQR
ncbi:MAG: TraR/DksA family transcriptional regulator [Acidimicrobiia bacterium]